MIKLEKTLKTVVALLISIVLLGSLASFSFLAGYSFGFLKATDKAKEEIDQLLANVSSAEFGAEAATPQDENPSEPVPARRQPTWGGPDLWEVVNKKRVEFGVNPLIQRDELCTIASIRLNELLEAGKLDGHEGFSNLPERRDDLQWIFDKYGNISEFLVSGAQTADHAVELWENTLGHKKLLSGGEYVWGCIYAQNSFGVAITAY